MKQIIKTAFICGLSVSSNVFSIDPVQGLYFSPALAISVPVASPAINVTFNQISYSPKINLNPVGGGFNMALGTRLNQVRLEGEFLFNYIGYNELTIGSCTLISPKVSGPKGNCTGITNYFQANNIGFSGNTTSGYAFFNAFYDFLISESTFFPYIGAGLGGAYVRNTANFRTNDQATTNTSTINHTFNSSKAGFAAQGILGFGYFMDDFATLGLDVRYTSAFSTGNNNTNSVAANTATSNSQHGLITINLIATFALEKTK